MSGRATGGPAIPDESAELPSDPIGAGRLSHGEPRRKVAGEDTTWRAVCAPSTGFQPTPRTPGSQRSPAQEPTDPDELAKNAAGSCSSHEASGESGRCVVSVTFDSRFSIRSPGGISLWVPRCLSRQGWISVSSANSFGWALCGPERRHSPPLRFRRADQRRRRRWRRLHAAARRGWRPPNGMTADRKAAGRPAGQHAPSSSV